MAKRRNAPEPKRPRTSAKVNSLKTAKVYDFAASAYLRHTEKEWYDKPFLLEPWQFNHLWRPILGTLDEHGNRWFKQALIGLPREYGKSEISARFLLTIMLMEPTPNGEYGIVASSKDQARIVYGKICTMIRLDPELSAKFEIGKNEAVVKDTGAKVFVLPAEEAAIQGHHFTVCIIDEMHVHKSTAIYTACRSGMNGKNSLLLIITTAARKRTGPLWDYIVPRFLRNPRAYVYWLGGQTLEQQIANEPFNPSDRRMWRRIACASWHSVEEIAEKFEELPLPDFVRYVLNIFPPDSLGVAPAFNARKIDACTSAEAFPWDVTLCLGIDGAVSGDAIALVFTARDEEDSSVIHAYPVIIDETGHDGYYELEPLENLIYEYWSDKDVQRIGVDPAWLVILYQHLKDRYGIPIESYSQSDINMAAASAHLKTLIDEERLVIHGTDSAKMVRHLKNAERGSARAYGWRMTKSIDRAKIDAAIACSISAMLLDGTQDGGWGMVEF